jgi:hypothetical protein
MIESVEFKNWIRSHNNIDPDNFRLILVMKYYQTKCYYVL